MYQLFKMFLCIMIALAVNAQTINLRGIVSNSAGKPVANAILTLAKQGIRDTTGSDGAYSLTMTTAAETPMLIPNKQNVFIESGFLVFSLPGASPVKVELFDVKGNLLKKESFDNTVSGFYRFDLARNCRTAELLVIRAAIGNQKTTLRYLPVNNGTYTIGAPARSTSAEAGSLAKIKAINDTVKVTAPNYKPASVAITSYEQQLNITLDTAGGGGVGRSSGCGKTPTLKSGKQTIQSSGRTRNYMIRIPENYDNTHPYPLVFAFHWNGGNMNDVDGGGTSGYTWSYYGLRELADKSTNSKMIFVAPDGNGGWPNTNGQDLTFVDDLLKLIKGDLCIDTTRIFSMGFSYGGGMSFAIACARAKVFRAVAIYAGAQLSGCTGGTDPIAYIGFHSINDGTCNYAGGESLRNKFVTNNGCTPQTAARPVGQNHVITTYQGCKSGYPVVWCAFDGGGHTPAPVDGSSSGSGGGDKTWTKAEAWKFFTQF
jgi:poly(3-hydroxybutyrate) depolymerase